MGVVIEWLSVEDLKLVFVVFWGMECLLVKFYVLKLNDLLFNYVKGMLIVIVIDSNFQDFF